MLTAEGLSLRIADRLRKAFWLGVGIGMLAGIPTTLLGMVLGYAVGCWLA